MLLLFLAVLALLCVSVESFRSFGLVKRVTDHRSDVVRLQCASADASSSSIKAKLTDDMKSAMKAKEKDRLAGIRAVLTAIKQKEVDERIVVDDALAIDIMAKLVKTRRESITSYSAAGRQDLVDQETAELTVIQGYLPAQLTEAEVSKLVQDAIAKVGATSVKDMGKVMGELRGPLSGKADMAQVGALIKKSLSG
jgi:uncharacterized protein YqeY